MHTQPHKKWVKHDFLLLEAYKILNRERCGQCGQPRYVCQNESNDIQFKVVEEQCASKVAQALFEERAEKKRGSKGEPDKGIALRVEAYSVSGKDLTTFRTPYYEAQAAKLKETST